MFFQQPLVDEVRDQP
ncbi:hypothetical protein D021_4080A, partial [Vibrio parahaemolyticus 10296]